MDRILIKIILQKKSASAAMLKDANDANNANDANHSH